MGKSWTELYLEAVARADKAEEEYMEQAVKEYLARKAQQNSIEIEIASTHGNSGIKNSGICQGDVDTSAKTAPRSEAISDLNIPQVNAENKRNGERICGAEYSKKIRGYPRSKIKIASTYGNSRIKNSDTYQGNPSNDAGVSREMKTISDLNISQVNAENKGVTERRVLHCRRNAGQ